MLRDVLLKTPTTPADMDCEQIAGRLMSVLPRLQHTLKRDRLRSEEREPTGAILPGRRGQFHLMHVLLDSGPMTTHQLASRLEVSAPTISTMVHALHEHELVTRERDGEDQRVVWISLSETGRRAIMEERHRMRLLFLRRYERLSVEDQRLIAEAVPALERFLAVDGCPERGED